MKNTHIIILAGGQGTRMKSVLPKVLTKLNNITLLDRLLGSVVNIIDKPTIIVVYRKEEVMAATGYQYHYVYQPEQLGTGHAVMCAKPDLAKMNYDNIVILPGDCPLVSSSTILDLIKLREDSNAKISMASMKVPHFENEYSDVISYGRIIRNNHGAVERIVEYKDATPEQKSCTELNTGFYCFAARWLWDNIDKLKDNNNAHEYYVTDLVAMAVKSGHEVQAMQVVNPYEGMGINTPEHLARIEILLDEV